LGEFAFVGDLGLDLAFVGDLGEFVLGLDLGEFVLGLDLGEFVLGLDLGEFVLGLDLVFVGDFDEIALELIKLATLLAILYKEEALNF